MNFTTVSVEPLKLDGPRDLLSQDLMSPFVWRSKHATCLSLLIRAVPPDRRLDQPSGRIWYGECFGDAPSFTMDEGPLIVPGPDAYDALGVEDPTVVLEADACLVYYTALNLEEQGQLAYAEGADLRSLTKRGVALASSKSERNTKEATVLRSENGEWRLLYEYSRDNHSRIGLAYGPSEHGPWDEKDDPFSARAEHWDSWHLSTGPLVRLRDGSVVMFYNGADETAVWGIGWVRLTPDLSTVVERCDAPLIAPPAIAADDGRDIVFAASAIEVGEDIRLYYSRNDRELLCATVRQV